MSLTSTIAGTTRVIRVVTYLALDFTLVAVLQLLAETGSGRHIGWSLMDVSTLIG